MFADARERSQAFSLVRLVVTTVVPHSVGPRTRLRTALEGYYSYVIVRPCGSARSSAGPVCRLKLSAQLIKPI